jgi:enoyl-[acyl-carrier protein] reductase II
MLAAEVLGADAVQVGTRFAASEESSAHDKFKKIITEISEGDTTLALKQLTPVRLIRNKFFEKINEAERAGAPKEILLELLGKGRAKRGMFEGDLEEGELEIGQVSAAVNQVQPAGEILRQIWDQYITLKERICND